MENVLVSDQPIDQAHSTPGSHFPSDALLAAIVQSANDAIVSKQLDGTIVAWNPAAQHLFGYTASEALGMNIRRLIPADRMAEEDAIIERIHAGLQVSSFETERLRKDGTLVRIVVSVSPVRDGTGRIIGASKIARSIEDQIEARRQAERYRNIVVSATDGILAIQGEQTICYANPAAQRLFGYGPTELMGKRLATLIPDGLQESHQMLVDAFAASDDQPRSMGDSGRQLMARHRDGEVFPVDITISKFGTGHDVQLTAVIRDARPRIEADRLKQVALIASAASEAKSAFINRLSHELRTPLTVMLGFSEILESDPTSISARGKDMVQQIRAAGRHVLSLIDDLLDTACVEHGAIALRIQPHAAEAVLSELVTQLRPMAERADVQLSLQPGSAIVPAVLADLTRLRQVLYNLVSNAIKYNRPQGRVSLVLDTQDRLVRITVRDTGVGMEADQLEKLFIPYQRLGREHSGIPGSGLGLALSRELTQRMDGQLLVSSEPGVGTTFTLLLPAAAPTAPHTSVQPGASTLRAPATPRDTAAPALSGRVLCVDDNPVNRMLVEVILAELGNLQLEFAEDGASALKRLQAGAPDLVLLDLHLPDGHGLQWLQRARDQGAITQTKVVLFSASVSTADREQAEQLGVVGVMSKPFVARQLVDVVTAALGPGRTAR